MAGHLALLLSACKQQGIVCVDGRAGERIITAISDGVAVAGQVVGILATGIIAGTDDAGTSETFHGILLPKYNTDVDTIITSGDMCEIVIPTSGHRYNVATVDPGADKASGIGWIFGSTIGNMQIGDANIATMAPCYSSLPVADTSRFMEIVWGPHGHDA